MEEYIIEPLFDKVLILPEKPIEKTASGIMLPSASGEAPSIAVVQATGEGKPDKDGNSVPMKVKANDRILYKQWGTDSVKLNNKEYLLLKQEDILAIIKNKPEVPSTPTTVPDEPVPTN